MTPLWMLLLFCCGWADSAPQFPQSFHLSATVGQRVPLLCDGSAYAGEEDLEVSWEAMGNEVASIKGDEVAIDERYTDRVHFSSSEPRVSGDWSIDLSDVMLGDSDMFECIYRGRKTVSTVWLNVETPDVSSVVDISAVDDSVILPCYLKLPRYLSLNELKVWWENGGETLLKWEQEADSVYQFAYSFESPVLDPRRGYFPLYLSSDMKVDFTGEFTCWYRIKHSDEPKPGIPGTINVILKEAFNESGFENSTEEESGSTPDWSLPFATEEMPVILDPDSVPLEETSDTSPMEAYEETATSFPNGEPESVDWADFPWVRTGLIAGVLLVTAMVLCILGVLHKL